MKYANQYRYSNTTPYEIVKVISDKTLEVREMQAERDPTWKPEFYPGGFCGHCHNQHEQRWIIVSNDSNPVTRIRLTKKGWQDKYKNKFDLSDKPVRFYDYNF